MRTLDHPLKLKIDALRALMLDVAPQVAEGIKWNAPSFRTREYFATVNLRERKGLGVILHLGAKVKTLPEGGVDLKDPAKLLKWLGKDRAMVVFADAQDFEARKAAFKRVVKQWIKYV